MNELFTLAACIFIGSVFGSHFGIMEGVAMGLTIFVISPYPPHR